MARTVRSLAAEAGVVVEECVRRLRGGGLAVSVGAQRLDGPDLAAAMRALDLPRRRPAGPADTGARRRTLSEREMTLRLLRPLLAKGKVGREHTTPFENVWGHGFPDHLKAEAREMAEALLAQGCLAEKESQGRQHVWLTNDGQARLRRAEEDEVAAADAAAA